MPNMPDRPETWAWLSAWLQVHFPAFYAGALALFVAFWRIIYSGGRFRQLLIECPLCGLLGVGVHYGVATLGGSPEAGSFFACIVGLLGIESSRAAAQRIIDKQVEKV